MIDLFAEQSANPFSFVRRLESLNFYRSEKVDLLYGTMIVHNVQKRLGKPIRTLNEGRVTFRIIPIKLLSQKVRVVNHGPTCDRLRVLVSSHATPEINDRFVFVPCQLCGCGDVYSVGKAVMEERRLSIVRRVEAC